MPDRGRANRLYALRIYGSLCTHAACWCLKSKMHDYIGNEGIVSEQTPVIYNKFYLRIIYGRYSRVNTAQFQVFEPGIRMINNGIWWINEWCAYCIFVWAWPLSRAAGCKSKNESLSFQCRRLQNTIWYSWLSSNMNGWLFFFLLYDLPKRVTDSCHTNAPRRGLARSETIENQITSRMTYICCNWWNAGIILCRRRRFFRENR